MKHTTKHRDAAATHGAASTGGGVKPSPSPSPVREFRNHDEEIRALLDERKARRMGDLERAVQFEAECDRMPDEIEARNRRAFEYLDRKGRQQAIEEAAFAMRVLLVVAALAGLALAIGGAS